MSNTSERVNTLIKEHSNLNKLEADDESTQSGQNNRVREIRQELVQILQHPAGK